MNFDLPAKDIIELPSSDLENVKDDENRGDEITDTEIEVVNDNGELAAVELSEADFITEREPGELQKADTVEAFEVQGLKGVAATMERYDKHKGDENLRNEDNIIADPKTGLIGVLDGLGGEGSGDLASKSAEEAIPAHYQEALKRIKNEDVVNEIVKRQLEKINATDPNINMAYRKRLTDMVEVAMTKDPQMGKKALALLEAISAANANIQEINRVKGVKSKTTACVGFIHTAPDGTKWAVVANIGDSAAFKRRPNGEMVQLTQEDSLLNDLIAQGRLSKEQLETMKASPKTDFPVELVPGVIRPVAYNKLKVAMTAAMGAEKANASLVIRQMEPGSSLIMGTDGLVDKFETTDEDIAETKEGEMPPTREETNLRKLGEAVSNGTTLTERLNNLRKAAKARKVPAKKDDDIAIVIAEA